MTTLSLAITQLCQCPGFDIGHVLVCRAYKVPDGIQRLVKGEARQGCVHSPVKALSLVNEAAVNPLQWAWGRHDTTIIATNHADNAIEQVAELVGQVAIIGSVESLYGEITVFGRWYLSQQVVTQRICTVAFDQFDRVNRIAQRFSDLASIDGDVVMHEDGGGQRHVGREQHGWPVDGVEAENALADHMHSMGII